MLLGKPRQPLWVDSNLQQPNHGRKSELTHAGETGPGAGARILAAAKAAPLLGSNPPFHTHPHLFILPFPTHHCFKPLSRTPAFLLQWVASGWIQPSFWSSGRALLEHNLCLLFGSQGWQRVHSTGAKRAQRSGLLESKTLWEAEQVLRPGQERLLLLREALPLAQRSRAEFLLEMPHFPKHVSCRMDRCGAITQWQHMYSACRMCHIHGLEESPCESTPSRRAGKCLGETSAPNVNAGQVHSPEFLHELLTCSVPLSSLRKHLHAKCLPFH